MPGAHTDLFRPLSPARRTAAYLGWPVLTILVFLSLEAWNLYLLSQYTDGSWTSWTNTGFYLRYTPGQALVITSLRSQAMIAIAALIAAIPALYLSVALALLAQGGAFEYPRAAIEMLLITGVVAYLFIVNICAPPGLILDTAQHSLTIAGHPGHTAYAQIEQFSSCHEGDTPTVCYLSATGSWITLLKIPATPNADATAATQGLALNLQQVFLTTQ